MHGASAAEQDNRFCTFAGPAFMTTQRFCLPNRKAGGHTCSSKCRAVIRPQAEATAQPRTTHGPCRERSRTPTSKRQGRRTPEPAPPPRAHRSQTKPSPRQGCSRAPRVFPNVCGYLPGAWSCQPTTLPRLHISSPVRRGTESLAARLLQKETTSAVSPTPFRIVPKPTHLPSLTGTPTRQSITEATQNIKYI